MHLRKGQENRVQFKKERGEPKGKEGWCILSLNQRCVWGNSPYGKLWNHLDNREKRDLRSTKDIQYWFKRTSFGQSLSLIGMRLAHQRLKVFFKNSKISYCGQTDTQLQTENWLRFTAFLLSIYTLLTLHLANLVPIDFIFTKGKFINYVTPT